MDVVVFGETVVIFGETVVGMWVVGGTVIGAAVVVFGVGAAVVVIVVGASVVVFVVGTGSKHKNIFYKKITNKHNIFSSARECCNFMSLIPNLLL